MCFFCFFTFTMILAICDGKFHSHQITFPQLLLFIIEFLQRKIPSAKSKENSVDRTQLSLTIQDVDIVLNKNILYNFNIIILSLLITSGNQIPTDFREFTKLYYHNSLYLWRNFCDAPHAAILQLPAFWKEKKESKTI